MLTDEDIRIETIVSHRQLGAGKIVDVGGNGRVMVDFASEPGHSMSRDDAKRSLRKLRVEGLEASLILNPEETRRWADEAPLRLVAAALVDIDRRPAQKKSISEKLTPDLVSPDAWERWWNRVQPKLKDSPLFDYSRKGTRLAKRLSEEELASLSEPTATPKRSESGKDRAGRPPTSATARLSEWAIWVQSNEPTPLPDTDPPETLIPFLRGLATEVTPRAIERLYSDELRERVLPARRAAMSARANVWLDCLAAALDRWLEILGAPSVPVAEFTKLAARLDGDCESLVRWLADYASRNSYNSEAVARAALLASQETPDGTRRLLEKLNALLDGDDKAAFWRQMFTLDANRGAESAVRDWLKILEPAEQANLISSLLIAAQDEKTIRAAESLLKIEWRRAKEEQRHCLFGTVALGWILHENLRQDMLNLMREDAVSFGENDQAPVDSRMTEWRDTIQSAAQFEIARVREEKEREIRGVRSRLGEVEDELERTNKQANYLRGELGKKNSGATLDISGDAIEILGEALQIIAAYPVSPSKDVSSVKAKVELAIRSLGAEPFGKIGEIEPYDQNRHVVNSSAATSSSSKISASDSQIRVTAPGVRYIKGVDPPLVLIKVQGRVVEV